MKICLIIGTRPEIIKISSLVKECERVGIEFFIIHTGQHYSYEMEMLFFQQLALAPPKYNLGIKSRSAFFQGEHIGRMLIEIEDILLKEKPKVVLVQGDTNTVLATAICVNKLRTSPINMPIRLGHVEAGLRSFDRTMTEEINRVLADHLSDYLFAPSALAKEFLMKEAIAEQKIYVTGNTIVDVVKSYLSAAKASPILSSLGLVKGNYFFVTAHRQENVDSKERLKGILDGLEALYKEFAVTQVYSLHPRTKKMMEAFGLSVPVAIRVIEPVGFIESLQLQLNAKLILTDSGGMQEEASILRIPCVTLRENTERPETMAAGFNILAGTEPERIVKAVKHMLTKSYTWYNLYGDGDTGKQIIDILKRVVTD